MKAMISNIVFTKNRPLQLDGYLRSLYQNLPADLIDSYVLWKDELFTEQYKQLFAEFPDLKITRESSFAGDLLNILSGINTKYILFGIDDVVYFDSVRFDTIDNTFEKIPDAFGFSLRLSKQNTLQETSEENFIRDDRVYSIDWTKAKTDPAKYPFELCATIYRTELVKKIIKSSRNKNHLISSVFSPETVLIKLLKPAGLSRKVLKSFGYFYSPNTLESWNCRWCQQNPEKLPALLYFQKQCACAVQVNLVNTTTRSDDKAISANTVEALNEKYKNGFRLDTDYMRQHKPDRTHCGYEYFKLVKK